MNWIINKLETKNVSGQNSVVIKAEWSITKADEDNTIRLDGKTEFSYQSGDPFTEYSDLTEAQVIQWIQNSLGSEGVAFYDNILSTHLVAHKERFPDVIGQEIIASAVYQPDETTALPW